MSKSRFLLGAVGAALAPAAFAQTWDDKVTISTGAKPVADVVAELSKASGMPMAVDGLAKNDIVFISLKDVSVRIAAEKIAAATGSKWVDQGGVFTLQRTAADERQQWTDDSKLRKVEIQNAIAETERQFEARTRGSQEQGFTNNQYQNAGFQAILAMIKLIPAEQLAAMEPDQRVVYSSRTTPMQKALPGGGMRIAQQYIADDIAWHQWSMQRTQQLQQQTGRNNRAFQQIQGNLDRLQTARIHKVLLIVQNQGAARFMVRLDLINAENQLISSANMGINEPNRRGDNQNQNNDNGGGQPLKFSDGAKAMANLWRQNRGERVSGQFISLPAEMSSAIQEVAISFDLAEQEQKPENIEDAIRALAANPDQYEPLNYFIPELLRLAAEAEGAGVVACIPDSAMQPSAVAILANSSSKKVWRDIANLQMTAKLEEGIYVVSPRLQSLSRYERMNRAAVAALIASAAKKGYASLDDLGQYAGSSSRGAFTGPLDSRLVAIAHPEAGNALRRNGNNQEALAIFASLGQQRRSEMIAGRHSVPLSATGATDETRWLTYNSFDGPVYRAQNQGRRGNMLEGLPIVGQIFFTEQVTFEVGQRDPSGTPARPAQTYQERTEMLPNGVPAATTVSLNANVSSMLRSSENQDQSGRTAMLTPEMLGAQRAQRDAPAFAEARANMPEYRVFTMAEQGTYTITITYADNYAMTRSLQEVKITPDSQPMAYGDLPSDIRKRIDDAYNQTYEQMKNMRVGRGEGRGGGNGRGGGTPPP